MIFQVELFDDLAICFTDLFFSHAGGSGVNTPNLKQHQSRNIKPPVYTQQVSYHSMNHAVVRGYKHRSIHRLIA